MQKGQSSRIKDELISSSESLDEIIQSKFDKSSRESGETLRLMRMLFIPFGREIIL